MRVRVRRPTRLSGKVRVPGDKSITHRAILLASMAEGTSRIRDYLDGTDCRATMDCVRALGAQVTRDGADLVIEGKSFQLWEEPRFPLDCVRSGTTMRLLAGLLAGRPWFSVLTGDPQLLRRPMGRIVEPLRAMGAHIDGRAEGHLPPLAIRGGDLKGIRYEMPVASAQVKSCLLLAGLSAEGETMVIEPGVSRDHTERMLRARGVPVQTRGLCHTLQGPVQDVPPLDVRVPGDFSSAAYLVAAALMGASQPVTVCGVGINRTRTGLLDAIALMGASVDFQSKRDNGGEPVANLVIQAKDLVGATLPQSLVPRMIDEFPVLALLATQASGQTVVTGAQELRSKETDRIAALAAQLGRLGARIEERPDGFLIDGPTRLQGAVVDSGGDHRLAMTLAVAGLVADGETVVEGAECIVDSFPGFDRVIERLAPGAMAWE
ncbi:MAG: 3-phosphoshikimate 1-carboxyvinyltransferase [Anaerolineae bacterium]|nr:3-phosphoshikimate 1-carboxyvinyltransferase [Anaerolineae bacterium]